jgi:hypothetical protein
VNIDAGVGDVNAPGLARDGGVYTKDACGHSEVTLRINIDAGVG